jgi:uncharacterized protein YggU (UPF0235/DUF167 family)
MKTRTIDVKVKTRAKRPGLTEEPDGSYTVRTTAAPDRGQANQDVICQLAKHFGAAKSCVSIISGHTGSRKRIRVTQ